ncbi:hypothetical protein AUP68_10584 [Ilyonectria robusta]
MSSPTLEAVSNISKVLSEAALIHREPAAEVKKQRSQLRFTRSLIIQQINDLKRQWREAKVARDVPHLPRLTFNMWLTENNYTDQYNALEAQRKEHNDTLKQETQIPFSQAQEEARRAYRPTLAMNPNAWPPSDEVVQFTGITTFEDDDDDDIELIGLQDQQEEVIPDPTTPPGMTSSPPLSPVDLPSSQHHDFTTTLPPPAPIRRQTRYQGIMRILREPRGQ